LSSITCALSILPCPLSVVFNITAGQKAIPKLLGQRIHDEAKVLKHETIEHLESQLKIFEDSTSNQIAVLIVSSLDGEVSEE